MQTKTLSVHPNFYPEKKLQHAVSEFSEYGNISVEYIDIGSITITFNTEEDVEMLCHEFMNYVLSI